MKLTISSKMFMIGLSILLVASVLAGNAYYTNITIQKATARAEQTGKEMNLLHKLFEMHSNLMFSAMHLLADRESGDVSEEVVREINTSSEYISVNLPELDRLANKDKDAEKTAVKHIQNTFPILKGLIQNDFMKLIRNDSKSEKIHNIHKAIDEYGNQVKDDLAVLLHSVHMEQKKNSEYLANLIADTTIKGFIAYIFILVTVIPTFIIISRSIDEPIR